MLEEAMEKDFSKFELTSGLISAGKKLPVATPSVKKNLLPKTSVFNNSVLLGIAVLFFVVLLLAALVWSVHHARHRATQPELLAQLQMHHARLTNAAQQIMRGDGEAFTSLQDHDHLINQEVTLLLQGGTYRNGLTVPAANRALLSSLEEYHGKLRQQEKKIHLILSQQQSLVLLNNSIKGIAVTQNQLNRRTEELIGYMAQSGNLAQEMRAVEVIKLHARAIAKNIRSMLPLDTPLAEITQQLIQDQVQISAMTQTLRQGYSGLGAASGKDETIQDLLSHIYALVEKFDHHLHTVQKEIPVLFALQPIIEDIIDSNETALAHLDTVDAEIQQSIDHDAFLFDLLVYLLGTATIAALILLIRSIRRNAQYQDWINRNEMQKTQKAIVMLLDDMKRIADGDLTVRTDITNSTTGAIADAINCTIEELHTLVEQVNQATALVVKASNQAQQVSSGLMTASQHQTEKIEQTTIAVLGMTESISEISDMATESARVAKQSLAAAEKGATAVRETIAGMNDIRTYIQDTSKRIKRLGESSQEIGEIVALISDITEQTNVLALNAALQATAAGETGHGFTVIAQEIQRLAERSTEASKQISELIKTIQGDTQDAIAAMERSTLGVAKGAKRSDAAGRTLEEIEQVSKQLAQLVSTIFDVTTNQTRAAHKVVANMEEILHITRQNAEGTLKTAGSIKQIAGFASELKASVSNFKV